MQMRSRSGLILLAVYIGSIVLANWLTSRFGLLPVGFGLMTTAGTLAIGGAVMTRDLVQDALGRWPIFAAIIVGAVLSYLLSSPAIAVASGATFLLAETLELVVYTPLRRRVGWGTGRWGGVVALANATGILADTLLFLTLAGFPLTAGIILGQLIGKAYITIAVVLAGLSVRRWALA